MNKMKIQIIAPVFSGKTTITKALQNCLNYYGIKNTVKDADLDSMNDNQKKEIVNNVFELAKNLEVEIETIQARRSL
jgi:phosphopantetheinyl transferase (holo-ACP synthase)